MNISGRIKVKAKVNDVTGKVSYRTILTSKNLEGETIFLTVFINLAKEARNKPIDNDSYIDIKEGFITFDNKDVIKTDKNTGNQVTVTESNIRLVISDFDYCVSNETPEIEFETIDDNGDGLPF